MWVRVKSMDGTKCVKLHGLSKLTKIVDLRNKLVEHFSAPVEHQRLFFKGKQLEDGYTLYDYDVEIDDTIQIFVQPILRDVPKMEDQSESDQKSDGVESTCQNKENEPCHSETSSQSIMETNFFKVGDIVDAKEGENGAWFEAKIVEIIPTEISSPSPKNVMRQIEDRNSSVSASSRNEESNDDNAFNFRVLFETLNDEEVVPVHRLRPRAKKIVPFDEIKEGDIVMVNYNEEETKKRGYFYDCLITKKVIKRNKKELIGTVFLGLENIAVENCHIHFVDEVFAIENRVPLSQRKLEEFSTPDPSGFRQVAAECSHCEDKPNQKCTHCSCSVCGNKDHPDKQILCDECNTAYHIWCLDPPLEDVPVTEDWYCAACKNDDSEIVKAGDKLKASKKKAKMPSAKSSSSRDWGRGMACAGRRETCTIVPKNHFGPIPGVEVGMQWEYRIQVSETGVHRPPVGGIGGRAKEGAYSIVLSGGYEDDVDNGEEFFYTGAGGRDLSDNKRTAEQSEDQKLTLYNKALAVSCAAEFNENGAEAKDWKKGKPVRVLRSAKGRKHSKYCPEQGYRYDGIYKVVKYWPERGKSGFLVWRYLLRRDDPTPAPWTKAGKKRIKDLGFVLQKLEKEENTPGKAPDGEKKKKKETKRHIEENHACSPVKKPKLTSKLSSSVASLIEKDIHNQKIWDECKSSLTEGYGTFLKLVQSSFSCICCQDMVKDPVTTECCHNICKDCLQRSFKAKIYSCPMCRHELGKNYALNVNTVLKSIVLELFPGFSG